MSEISPAQFEALQALRRTIADMQRDMDNFQELGMSVLQGDDDITEVEMTRWSERIARLESQVEALDPDGVTVLDAGR